jgi:predicted RNase H-like nuclease (RuvC/YqgF family)
VDSRKTIERLLRMAHDYQRQVRERDKEIARLKLELEQARKWAEQAEGAQQALRFEMEKTAKLEAELRCRRTEQLLKKA